MKAENIVQSKSYNFALRIIKIYKYLSQEKKSLFLSKQLLRSGTSIGANIEEAIGVQSKQIFLQNYQYHTKKLENRNIESGFCEIHNI